jgi:hypothetical protein
MFPDEVMSTVSGKLHGPWRGGVVVEVVEVLVGGTVVVDDVVEVEAGTVVGLEVGGEVDEDVELPIVLVPGCPENRSGMTTARPTTNMAAATTKGTNPFGLCPSGCPPGG